jgi:chromate transporter
MLREIAISFLRLGTTAFGGPAAHIALMEEEFVRRRGWLSHAEFLDLLGATNLIPGPNSTEMAIHIGHQRAGWKGLVVGGVCFIVPAMLIVMAAAWAYVRYGSLPQFRAIMYGIKPVIVAIILQALWRLAPIAVKNGSLALVGSIALAAAIFSVSPLMILCGAGCCCSGNGAEQAALFHRPGRDSGVRMAGYRAHAQERGCGGGDRTFQRPGTFPFFFSRSARCSMGAAMCCSPFCKRTS